MDRNNAIKSNEILPRNPAPAPIPNALVPPPPNRLLLRRFPKTLVPPPYLYIFKKSIEKIYEVRNLSKFISEVSTVKRRQINSICYLP